ncbi:MAG TPA: acyltransferase [Candidatus Polarisedimenticolia bacterium]|nr:acyltransferase [Candidatus Polarisedimenticolia bacterium]
MIDAFILKVKRGKGAFFRFLQRVAKGIMTQTLPLPRFVNPLLGALYDLHQIAMSGLRWAASYLYREPLFRGRCESLGKRFTLSKMPYVVSHAKIFIGDDVNFFGKVDIFSGRIFDEPRLIIHNRVDIGHNVLFVVNKHIEIEDDVNVASGVRFMDTDAHPRDVAERIADLPPRPEEIKPVRVCKNAWIGQNSFVLKGVTIGEGAIIGVNSVVVTDIPPYSVAMGNPARVVVKNMKASALAGEAKG